MKIDTFILGDYQTNCYVLRESSESITCQIIDPGYSPQPLLDFLQENNLTADRIVLTHGHADHIAAIAKLKQLYPDLPVWIARNDADMLTDDMLNLSVLGGQPLNLSPADLLFDIGDTLEIASKSFTVLSTPGHTTGGVSLYCQQENLVFSGDALFAGSIGRSDFPGGNHDQLIEAIRKELLTLDEKTTVYPGHGPATTIDQEKKTNPFFQ
jgi:hydroxyacylglutathione hydrolase